LKEYVREHRLHDAVTFVGNVPDVAAYLQAADCFVLPSQVESFSLSLAEALSCGLPCVATAVGGILDLVVQRHSGLLVPYGDEEALATAVRELLGDVALARRLGAAARQEMTRHFDIDHVADAYRTLLERT
jgi:glycosyltransferase involved in cell wall biosynthesis